MTGVWWPATRSRYLVKVRSLVHSGKTGKGRLVRRGPWRTVKRLNNEADALAFAATLSPRYETKVYYQGKRV